MYIVPANANQQEVMSHLNMAVTTEEYVLVDLHVNNKLNEQFNK